MEIEREFRTSNIYGQLYVAFLSEYGENEFLSEIIENRNKGFNLHVEDPVWISTTHAVYLPVPDVMCVSLEQVYLFDSTINSAIKSRPEKKLVVCRGSSVKQKSAQLVLLGCHLIMSRGFNFEETLMALRPVCEPSDELKHISMVNDTLRCVCCAKYLNWISFNTNIGVECEPYLEMDEYMHYARSETDPAILVISVSYLSFCQQSERLSLHYRPKQTSDVPEVLRTYPPRPTVG